ncbi:MAG: hypothetical protein LBF26_00575 [Puniceicoccales bacterium]|jgi:hypothetical protein|nr:hypothetical protein [Puniceicoccales bacterium]
MNRRFNPIKHPEFGSPKWKRYCVARAIYSELQVSPSREVWIRIPKSFAPIIHGMPDHADYWYFIEIFEKMELLKLVRGERYVVTSEFENHFKEWADEIEADIPGNDGMPKNQQAYDWKIKLIVEKEGLQCSKLFLQWAGSNFSLKSFHDNSCTEIATLYVLENPGRDIGIDEVKSECIKRAASGIPNELKFYNIISLCDPKSPLSPVLRSLFFNTFNERLVHFRGMEIK